MYFDLNCDVIVVVVVVIVVVVVLIISEFGVILGIGVWIMFSFISLFALSIPEFVVVMVIVE